ncbi:hypothetical protein [Streptomyces sp. NPDC058855]|uniref:hypothetical protein n=1 Tax=Streptomyces sp. NPDC058855 TaxID=3346651 RepID=UPI0036A43631
MVGGGFLGLLLACQARDDVRTRSVFDRSAYDFGNQEELVLRQFLRDAPRRLRSEPQVPGCLAGAGTALFVGHDPAVEEDTDVVPRQPGLVGEHRQQALERDLPEPATEAVGPTLFRFVLP